MPKYTFTCPKCKESTQIYTLPSIKYIECNCGEDMDRKLPKLRGLKTTEVIDKFTNKKHITDHKEIVKERKADYYWEVHVPEMVNSGQYELSTMLEQGWVFYNERGDLITRTKPPQKA